MRGVETRGKTGEKRVLRGAVSVLLGWGWGGGGGIVRHVVFDCVIFSLSPPPFPLEVTSELLLRRSTPFRP